MTVMKMSALAQLRGDCRKREPTKVKAKKPPIKKKNS